MPEPCSPDGCRRGLLISMEGINGVGKTHLTALLMAGMPDDSQIISLDGFTQRHSAGARNLGNALLDALKQVSRGDRFLRSGHPGAELLLLLAIKAFDFEHHARPALLNDVSVIEGRSLDTVAVYQALIMHPHDEHQAAHEAHDILQAARPWRPMPDLTILVVDDVERAADRADQRDRSRRDRDIDRKAARLYHELATADPARVWLLDRRIHDASTAVRTIATWIAHRTRQSRQCIAPQWRPHRPCGVKTSRPV